MKKYFLFALIIIVFSLLSFMLGYKFGLAKQDDNTLIQDDSNKKLYTTSTISLVEKSTENINTYTPKYYKDMSEEFKIIIDKIIKDEIYYEYGITSEFTIKSLNDYNTLYALSNETDIEHQSESIEIQTKILNSLAQKVESVYNVKVTILDNPINSLK